MTPWEREMTWLIVLGVVVALMLISMVYAAFSH